MCVAVIKPSGVEIPDKETLFRCFRTNPDGAGFAIYRNGKILIKKGYMGFDDFYNAFLKEKPQKDENIFIHFRIATHGLVDCGNTHPFPISDDFETMRKVELEYSGKVMVHNGIFRYTKELMHCYDPTDTASDTMVFDRIVFDEMENFKNNKTLSYDIDYSDLTLEELIALQLTFHNNSMELLTTIDHKILGSRVAVMLEDGSIEKYGDWIDHKGCFYSNHSFEDYSKYYTNTMFVDDDFTEKYLQWKENKTKVICDFCGQFCDIDDVYCCYNDENICVDCLVEMNLYYCRGCQMTYEESDMKNHYLCKYCASDGVLFDEDGYEVTSEDNEEDTVICVCCGQNTKKSQLSKYEDDVCKKCYEEYFLN